MIRALVIPVTGPVEVLELDPEAEMDTLSRLQAAVGGWIELVPLPSFIADAHLGVAYVNEEGKLERLPFNGRATDFMVPGIGIFMGDYIAGPMVVSGFDSLTGKSASIPPGVERRIRLIESEAQ